MIPIYATVSFLSYLFYRHAVYFDVLRDCYEAFAIASFFTLLCHYIAPDLHAQKEWFRDLSPRGWVLPISWFKRCCGGDRGIWRTPRSGLTWFNIVWIGVFQYCFIRVFFTIVSVVTQAFGRYCESSLHPAFAHIWVMLFEGSAVSIAMYCLIQFYIQLRTEIAEHRPFLKILCIKLVIFFSFWQTLVISFLTSSGALKPSKRIASPDIKVGFPSMLLCIEMAIFSVMHLFAFPWKEYSLERNAVAELAPGPGFSGGKAEYLGGFMGWKAYLDAFNPWDMFKATGRGFRWIVVGRSKRLQDPSYKNSGIGLGMEPPKRTGTGARPANYQLVDGDEDAQLLSHAGPNPSSQPFAGDVGMTGGAQRWNEDSDQSTWSLPGAGDQQQGVVGSSHPPAPYYEDTGYHGAQSRPPGGAPGGQWNMWGGAERPGEPGGALPPYNRNP